MRNKKAIHPPNKLGGLLASKSINGYKEIAKKVRRDILRMIYETKSPHIGPCFSTVEILVALYFRVLSVSPDDPCKSDRDRFILSKGHGCPALYATLARRGFLKRDVLNGFAVDNGTLEQHPTRNLAQGIEASTGSLGHGLSMGIGMAVSGKYDGSKHRIYVLLSDGECNEGSVWEAAMFAPRYGLDNLVAIIDYNKMQAMGGSDEIMGPSSLADKWRAFGWPVCEIDGHDFEEILEAFERVPFRNGRPSLVIANTVKGKGVSFMENSILWHYRHPNEEEYKRALGELK